MWEIHDVNPVWLDYVGRFSKERKYFLPTVILNLY